MSAQELADLMNAWKRRSDGKVGSSDEDKR
jgi:hypothetical protein